MFRGEFSPQLAGVARPCKLHLIDAWWTLYGERFPDWGDYTDFGTLGTRQAFEEARRAVPDAIFHVGDDLEILLSFPDGYFDWVYLDTTHEYVHTCDELAVLDRKVTGFILGDDWHDDPAHPHAGVAKAVREFTVRSAWNLLPRDSFGQWGVRRVVTSDSGGGGL